MTIEDACDKIVIQEVISSHSMFADCGEFAAINDCITPDATYDYSSAYGDDFKCVHLSDFLGEDSSFLGFDATQHQITNFVIELDGDRASARSQVRATHRIDKEIYVMGGSYRHQLVRVGGTWKICATTFTLAYEEGDPRLPEKAAVRAKAKAVHA